MNRVRDMFLFLRPHDSLTLFSQCEKLADVFKNSKDRFDLVISPFLRKGK